MPAVPVRKLHIVLGTRRRNLASIAGGAEALVRESGSASGEPYPHKVGQKRANPWGLFDMHGNAAEWCRDAFDENAYHDRKEISIDPIHAIGNRHVYRGGQWAGNAWLSRCAYRFGVTEQAASRPNTIHGFRVVRSQ